MMKKLFRHPLPNPLPQAGEGITTKVPSPACGRGSPLQVPSPACGRGLGRGYQKGFTLIEVLLALAVIAIALTALLKATSQDVANTQRLKEKTIRHWIAMQGVSMIQLGLIQGSTSHDITEITTMLGERWYWRVKLSDTSIKTMQQMTITVSKNQSGPFTDPLIAYRHLS